MLNKNLCKIFKESGFGYACHKLITNYSNYPVDYIFMDVNTTFEQLTGLTKSEIINKTVREVFKGIENDSFNWIQYYGEISLKGKSAIFEQFSENLKKWYRVHAFSPKRGYFITLFSDITEEKNKLFEIEEFFNLSIDFLFITDFDGRFLKNNKEWEKLLGYSENELKMKSLLDFLYLSDKENLLHLMSNLKADRNVLNYNIKIMSSNRGLRNLECRSHTDGIKVYTAAKDLSDLLKSEERFRKAFHAGSTLMAISEISSGRFIDVNESFIKVTGYLRDEVIGRTAVELNLFADLKEREFALNTIKRKSSVDDIEVKIRVKSGEIKTGLFSINRLDTDIGPCWLTSMTDISERKIIEENLEAALIEAHAANKAKSEFISNISHEIRTPLNGVLGFSDLLMQTNLNDEQLQYASIVNKSGRRLLEMVNDILDFSRLESGSYGLNNRYVNILDILNNIAECSRKLAVEKGLKFIFNVSGKIPNLIEIDPGRLKQVIINILNNAVKFTDRGEVELKVLYRFEGDDKGRLDIYVRDTGLGIPLEKQKLLFNPFTPLDSSKTKTHNGAGLGLAISKKLILQMGGKIDVCSKPGEGSIFHCSVKTVYKNIEEPVLINSFN